MTLDEFIEVLPKHEDGYFFHNKRSGSNDVENAINSDSFNYEHNWVSEAEKLEAISTNELWTFKWYVNLRSAPCTLHASSLEAIANYLKDNQE